MSSDKEKLSFYNDPPPPYDRGLVNKCLIGAAVLILILVFILKIAIIDSGSPVLVAKTYQMLKLLLIPVILMIVIMKVT